MSPLRKCLEALSMLFDFLRGVPAEWAEGDGGQP